MDRKNLVIFLAVLLALFIAAGCKGETPPSTEPPGGQISAAADYAGTDSCKNCHKKTHSGFIKSNHYNTFKPISAYNIPDLPEEITVFDTSKSENPPSATIKLAEVYGVMVDDYVIAPIPAAAGFSAEVYRVAAVHKEGDSWKLEPARAGDFNKDGQEDWGGSPYTCGSCHSPGLGKNDEELTIGCESCHGPGGEHIAAEEKAGTMKVSQDACMACHPSEPAKNNQGVWEANNHYGTRNYFASKHAETQQLNDCIACHTPHSVNNSGKSVIGDDPVNDNCKLCHTQNFDLSSLMWRNPSDPHNHFVKDHSFGAMPYDKLGDDPDTKPVEITNPEMIKIIEDKLE